MKRLLFTVLIVSLCATSLGVYYDRLEQRFLPRSSDLMVFKLPANYQAKTQRESYQGLHPALLTRPAETFPFPIALNQVGPSQALFSGESDYPFLCATERSGLGQPLIDNRQKEGIAVYALNDDGSKTKDIAGYSKDCNLETKIQYFVKDEVLDGFLEVEDTNLLASDVSKLIRVEVGTINRFIYVLALPVTKADLPEKFDPSQWNSRLIYRFKGGVGVGHQQGNVSIAKLLYDHEEQLGKGYALAFSTGTQTSNHYDIWLSEDTALRVKKQFSSRYGQPIYTIGMGGSGGAIQQYLLSQNHPGIIDAAIPLYSYPDMVTQVNYALDCELMEYYFDMTSDNDKWQQWPNRRLIEGSNALQGFKNRYGKLQGIAGILNANFSLMPKGASECTNGWRGPSHNINNPYFYSKYYQISDETFNQIDWSHWGNMAKYYGSDAQGLGQRFWDNQGVQYGLNSLLEHKISMREFIDLNAYIGGWKKTSDMENERFWHISGDDSLKRLSLWSQHNMTHDGKKMLAARTHGNQAAIDASYSSGLVFLGLADLPIIDLRHYLDDQLDMHHSVASFTTRKRIEAAMGQTDHHLIWMMEKNNSLSRKELLRSLPISDALLVLDQWLINMKTYPDKTVAQNRPVAANDRCYDGDQNVIDKGLSTWDGQWNGKEKGICQQRFPHFQHSRLMAGDNIYTDTLQCQRVPLPQAVSAGLYGGMNMSPYLDELAQVFPDGVCLFDDKPNLKVSALLGEIKKHQLKKH